MRLGRWIAVLIVVVSMLGAVVSWRASVWSGTAAGLDRQATQELLTAEQARTADHAQVAQDLRLFGRYQRERLLARITKRDDTLRDEARDRAAVALALSRMLTASIPVPKDGRVAYDTGDALRFLGTIKPDLARADPRYLSELAGRAHQKTVRLVLIGTMFIATLFFLTLAEISRSTLRRLFGAGGVALGLVATVWFVLQTSPLPTV